MKKSKKEANKFMKEFIENKVCGICGCPVEQLYSGSYITICTNCGTKVRVRYEGGVPKVQ